MLPGDPVPLAQVREMQHIISSDIQPIANLRVLGHLRNEFGAEDEAVNEWCREWIGRGFDAFEQRAADRSTDGRFSFGDSLTLADAWLLPQVYNAVRFELDMAPYPTIRSIVDYCSAIEAVAAAHPDRQPDAPDA
jgi:maleylacetoacetate isomerase